MRFKNLLSWDIRFQARYGFYFLYGFLTALYAMVLISLPVSWREKAAAILIFSDPAAMGLFFMGAIVLLEKSQKVTSFFAITPLKAWEYVASKVLSLCTISVIVAGLLVFVAGSSSILSTIAGTCIASAMFTLFGVIVATRITSLNQFILATVPVEILGFVPGLLHLFGVGPLAGRLYPANACMDLIAGREVSLLGILFTLALIGALFYAAVRCVEGMWIRQEGVKL